MTTVTGLDIATNELVEVPAPAELTPDSIASAEAHTIECNRCAADHVFATFYDAQGNFLGATAEHDDGQVFTDRAEGFAALSV